MFYVLRGFLSFRRSQRGQTAEEYMTRALDRSSWKGTGLEDAVTDIAGLQAACGRLFPGLKDWRGVRNEWFDPTREGLFTNEVSRASGVIRDRHIFKLLTRRAGPRDRVFVVIGASHVPMLEPAFVAVLGPPVRKRNGTQTIGR